jgi:hypothetical protein
VANLVPQYLFFLVTFRLPCFYIHLLRVLYHSSHMFSTAPTVHPVYVSPSLPVIFRGLCDLHYENNQGTQPLDLCI